MPTGVYTRTTKTRKKTSLYMTGRIGAESPAYKDGRATYEAIHEWLKFHYKKGDTCEHCGQQPRHLDWANISGEYRRDRNDFKVLCKSCHKIYDNKNMCGKKLHELTPENSMVRRKLLPSGLLRRECKACIKIRMEKLRVKKTIQED